MSEEEFKSSESFVFRELGRNGGSKSISMVFSEINPQNELGDIISEPQVELNTFQTMNLNLFLESKTPVDPYVIQLYMHDMATAV